MDNKVQISAVIIARNASQTIETTLASLARFSEVVLVDTGSTDDTIERSRAFPNVVIYEETFIGFGPTKNLAVQKASFDWVLSVDADESLDDELVGAVLDFDFSRESNVGVMHRRNFFLGKEIKHGGWGGDRLVRLFNRKETSFSDRMVHESVLLKNDSNQINVRGALNHNAISSIDQYLHKVNAYSTLKNQTQKKKVNLVFIFLLVAFKFINVYFFKLGLLDGWRGAVIAFGNAVGVFFKHIKRYE